jgi:hypothetical protein
VFIILDSGSANQWTCSLGVRQNSLWCEDIFQTAQTPPRGGCNENQSKWEHRGWECLPILLQIVTRSSPTVLESSTITVFTDPSNIRIFWGLCFFLYSKISYSTSHTHVSHSVGQQTTDLDTFLWTMSLQQPPISSFFQKLLWKSP